MLAYIVRVRNGNFRRMPFRDVNDGTVLVVLRVHVPTTVHVHLYSGEACVNDWLNDFNAGEYYM